MLKKHSLFIITFLVFLPIFCVNCGGNKKNEAASMEQLYAENGFPISIRQLETEDFSVFLKYPAVINASSESIARAALDDVVRNISARVGQTVKQGDVIVSFSSDNKTLQQAVLAHENARNAFNRANTLFRSNDISRQDFDSVRMQYELAQTNLKAANDMVYVKAPISGTIAQINVHVTENVRPGMPLFTVSNNNAFEARLYVGVFEIERIKVGARAFIERPKNRPESQIIEGRVTQVSMIMDSQKQAFPVTVTVDGSNYRLVSGINIDMLIETYRNEKAIVLSKQEIVPNGIGPAVFITEDPAAQPPRVRKVAVQTGEEKGMRIEITGGLNEGDYIVSEGVQSITAESKINIVPAVGRF